MPRFGLRRSKIGDDTLCPAIRLRRDWINHGCDMSYTHRTNIDCLLFQELSMYK